MHARLSLAAIAASLASCAATAPRGAPPVRLALESIEAPFSRASPIESLATLAIEPPALAARAPTTQSASTELRAIDLLVGVRAFDDDEFWTPVDEHTSFGLQFAWQGDGDPIGFETGFLLSQEDDSVDVGGVGTVSLDMRVIEIFFGLHHGFGSVDSTLRPYVGGGLTTLIVEVDGDVAGVGSAQDDDTGIAVYVHGGLAVQVSRSVRVGVDARWVSGSGVDVFGADTDLDYAQLSMLVGFSN